MSTLDLKWPELAEPYASALRDAVAFVLDRVDPVGIVACGSVIRGTPSPNSDLDIYVIHAAAWRQRIQRRFGTVPAEIFINPPSAIRGYFESERQAGPTHHRPHAEHGFCGLGPGSGGARVGGPKPRWPWPNRRT